MLHDKIRYISDYNSTNEVRLGQLIMLARSLPGIDKDTLLTILRDIREPNSH